MIKGIKMLKEKIDLGWETYINHLKDMMQNLVLSSDSANVTLVCEDKQILKLTNFF